MAMMMYRFATPSLSINSCPVDCMGIGVNQCAESSLQLKRLFTTVHKAFAEGWVMLGDSWNEVASPNVVNNNSSSVISRATKVSSSRQETDVVRGDYVLQRQRKDSIRVAHLLSSSRHLRSKTVVVSSLDILDFNAPAVTNYVSEFELILRHKVLP
ncbi:hypothetical protein CIRG_02467 [Coccidioides immitis RMSCC 2394]|uniref:Uncharacterized protein n=1 Tax=Coccidioides immitis RMSCC 2394 TaxID=404692 RepID=A0A0J6Y4V2_COCIT|nr:hypothetical protein CIRG_02467 [Coccidioides immitis RMSCC 2394]